MITIWTIYDHPKDFPNTYVARRFDGKKPTQERYAHKDLEEVRKYVRKQLPGGGVCFLRDKFDDAVILETWL